MVHVFVMKVTDIDFDDVCWNGYLSEERKRGAQRMRSDKNRRLHLGAETLLNLGLEAMGAKIARPAAYVRNEYGKPYLTGAEGLFANWSHSGEYAACAIADKEVGIDLQLVRGNPKEGLVRRVLRPEETAYYESVPPEQRRRLLYEYWTAKESFLKALGTGFRTPLDEFYIEMGVRGPRIIQRVNDKDYECRLLKLKPRDYAAAVCCEGGMGDILMNYL